jgi:hypothetical protein
MSENIRPFTTQRSLALNGGWLKATQSVYVHVQDVDGVDFVKLGREPWLQGALFGTKKRGLWKDLSLFKYMTDLRNVVVDEIIKSTMDATDPMADAEQSGVDLQQANKRAKLFHDAKVPTIITINLESFTTPDGRPIPAKSCKVMSTPCRRTAVHMEAIGSNFDWLVHAVDKTWVGAEKNDEEQQASDHLQAFLKEFEYMVPKPVKMKAVDSDKVSVWVWLRDSEGKWKKKKRSCINVNYPSDDVEHFKANLLRAARILKKEFDANHVHWEEPGDPQEGQVSDSAQ